MSYKFRHLVPFTGCLKTLSGPRLPLLSSSYGPLGTWMLPVNQWEGLVTSGIENWVEIFLWGLSDEGSSGRISKGHCTPPQLLNENLGVRWLILLICVSKGL